MQGELEGEKEKLLSKIQIAELPGEIPAAIHDWDNSETKTWLILDNGQIIENLSPKDVQNMTGIFISRVPDAAPKPYVDSLYSPDTLNNGNNYFFKQNVPTGNAQTLILIPTYNEHEKELLTTLWDLNINDKEARKRYDSYEMNFYQSYLTVQDGFAKCPENMRNFYQKLYKIPDEVMMELRNEKMNDTATYIFQNIKEGIVVPIQLEFKEKKFEMPLTLVIKKQNRSKANSHQWFFSQDGYAGAYNPEFCFSTDCSTMFHEFCLARLIKVMIREPKCVVCTGEQVVKTKEQQEVEDNFFEYILRSVQGYDFESSFASIVGSFAFFEFLPVVPGPCGLYRWKFINGKPLEKYFEFINRPCDQLNLVENNFKIAEDRILTYFAVFYAAEEVKMCLSPDSIFYFDAETQPKQLLVQRRRWGNGTAAGYIYVLTHPSLIFNSKLRFERKIFIFLLFIFQFLIYTVVNLTPAIFAFCYLLCLQLIFGDGAIAMSLFGLYILYYIAFVIAHVQKDFIDWSLYLPLFIGAITMIVSAVGSMIYLVTGDSLVNKFLIIMAYIYILSPIILSLHSINSFKRAIKFFIPYLLVLPTFVGIFGAYNTARISDFTWGSRPSSESQDAAIEAQERTKKLKLVGKVYTIFILLLNLFFIGFDVAYSQSTVFLLVLFGFVNIPSMISIGLSLIYWVCKYFLERLFVHPLARFFTKMQMKSIQSVNIADNQNVESLNGDNSSPITEIQPTLDYVYDNYYYLNNNNNDDTDNKNNNIIEDDVDENKNWTQLLREMNAKKKKPKTHDEISSDELKLEEINLMEENQEPKLITFAKLISMPILLFGINLCYQIIFQNLPYVLNEVGSDLDFYSYLGFIYQLLGFTSLIGILADKFKFQKLHTFNALAIIGFLIYFTPLISFFAINYFGNSFSSDQKYYFLSIQSIIQVIGLNIIGTATFVTFIRSATSKYLVYFMVIRALWGVIGNSISPLMVLGFFFSDFTIDSNTNNYFFLSIIGSIMLFLLLVVFLIVSYTGTIEKAKPITSVSKLFSRNRQLSFVYTSFFFLSLAYAPIQFGMTDYFISLTPNNANEGYLLSQFEFLLQGVIVCIIGFLCLLCAFSERNLNRLAVLVTLPSLLQLLFFLPSIGGLEKVSIFVITTSGIYRSFIDLFAFYYFAKHIHGITSSLGMWVASFNITLVIAQMIGSSFIAFFLTQISKFVDCESLGLQFAFAAVPSFLAIAAALRIPSEVFL